MRLFSSARPCSFGAASQFSSAVSASAAEIIEDVIGQVTAKAQKGQHADQDEAIDAVAGEAFERVLRSVSRISPHQNVLARPMVILIVAVVVVVVVVIRSAVFRIGRRERHLEETLFRQRIFSSRTDDEVFSYTLAVTTNRRTIQSTQRALKKTSQGRDGPLSTVVGARHGRGSPI